MKKIFPLLLLLTILLAACGQEPVEESPSPEPSVLVSAKPSEVETPSPEPSQPPEPFRKKLTGEPIEKEPDNSRPYAVMINNISVALPHMGVSQADIIYEVLAEGEITRMLAIFSDLSNVEAIGSMRSARPYYIELARSYDAIYVHAGGSEQAYSDISSKGVDNIDGVRGAYGDQIFYRDSTRMQYGTEHSLFTTGKLLLEYTPKLGYETEHSEQNYQYGLEFSDEIEMKNGAPANIVNVSFSGLKNTKFTYNDDGYYTAEQYGKAYIDGTTEESVQFKNLIILYAATKVLDNEGRRAVELTGEGAGHFICNGEIVDLTWKRNGNGQQFTYALKGGGSLTLGVGKTYIAIVPTGSTITAE